MGLMKYYSQIGQDKYLDEYIFKGKRNGTFIDIGAGDGINISNSYFFEKNRGWSGICVEPREKEFAQLIKNRNCKCENCCIADFDGNGEFLEIEGYSGSLSGLLNSYNTRHLKRIERELDEFEQKKNTIMVKCTLFDNLLIKYGLTHIDFCSIDTEGSEMAILKSIDFGKTDIDFFVVENNYYGSGLRKFMFFKGYGLVKKIQFDEVYGKITGFRQFFKQLGLCIKYILFRSLF